MCLGSIVLLFILRGLVLVFVWCGLAVVAYTYAGLLVGSTKPYHNYQTLDRNIFIHTFSRSNTVRLEFIRSPPAVASRTHRPEAHLVSRPGSRNPTSSERYITTAVRYVPHRAAPRLYFPTYVIIVQERYPQAMRISMLKTQAAAGILHRTTAVR